VTAARIVAAVGAAALVCLAAYRVRSGRPGRAALGLLLAALLALYASDQTAALPDGEDAVARAGDALGDWTYPFMAAMAFLETSIPPVTLVVPGEWAVMLGGAMAGEGQVEILVLIPLVWAFSAAGDSAAFVLGRRLGRPFVLRHGAPLGMTEARLTRLDGWLDRHGAAAVCLGRLIPLARPLGPFVTGASHYPYRRFAAWNALGTLLFTLLFCGSGYVFYRSYDEVAQVLSRAAFVAAAVIVAAGGAYLLVRRRRAVRPAPAGEATS
jgi:membrane protein DedA with SNARE-associated domain